MRRTERIPLDALQEIMELKREMTDLKNMVLPRIHDLALIKNRGFLFSETVYYTSDDTWTKADYDGIRAVRIRCQAGGGAAGAAIGNPALGGGGGGGGFAEHFELASALGSTETVTVGGGGTRVTDSNGNAGGDSSFGAHCSSVGGSGGAVDGGTSAAGGAGSGDVIFEGGQGGRGLNPTVAQLASGGGSHLGLGAPQAAAGATGSTANKYGGGGGGGHATSATNRQGGEGGEGIVIVEIYV